ncbi:MAG: ribonuclease E, partial [Synechococcaceae cyanobacterium]|nr:ribonuclease E [Synechococcaceae cyanobacterium]
CPSCGGLGHVAVLPGRDTLQPLATVSGLVRSAASARAEVVSPATAEGGGGGRRRRGSRGGRAAEPAETPTPEIPAPEAAQAPAAAEGNGSGGEGGRRLEPELVAVPMEPEQELVYGWMGLSPALLLDPVPDADQLVVRVVRPGADADAVLEEARQQLVAVGSRRRRPRRERGAGAGEAAGEVAGEAVPAETADAPSSLPEAVPAAAAVAGAAPGGNGELPPEDAGEPRRRRRRSSAAV